jgi:hypothetical protein
VRYQLGLVNLAAAPLRENRVVEDVLIESHPLRFEGVGDVTPAGFCDPAAGWVARRCAAPFVRILEVRDATPEEATAAAARRAANV